MQMRGQGENAHPEATSTYTRGRSDHGISDGDGEVSWGDTYDVLECCGCGEMNVRHEHWFSEWDSIEQDSRGNTYMKPGIKTTYTKGINF